MSAVQDWDARAEAWDRRVEALGVERSIYHKGHASSEAFASITQVQQAAIWPAVVAARQPTDRVVLDFGCGYGRWTGPLADLFGSAIGIDPTGALLEAARARVTQANVTFSPYTQGQIPLASASVDAIWSCMVLSTVLTESMLVDTLTEWQRVLRPGGLVLLIDNTSKVNGQPVRSGYSISRTVEAYQAAFAGWAPLTPVGHYVDLKEINTIFVGRRT